MENTSDKKRILTPILFSFVVLFFVVAYSMVGKATGTIDDLESQKQENESNQESFEEQASNLSESKSSLENLVSSLNSELEVIYADITDIESKIETKNSEIEATKLEIEEAQALEEQQYEDMKIRIKFMYEMGNKSYIDIFLSGDSMADGLNKAEYVSELVAYDRRMLESYRQTKDTIVEREALLIQEEAELEQLVADANEKKELILQKITSTNAEIVELAGEITMAEEEAIKFERQAAANQLAIEDESRRIEEESILERQRQEQESREQASREQASKDAENGNSEEETTAPDKPSYNPSVNDLDMLAAIIECEAGDQDYYGMLCVGAVVMNRVNSSIFPNTIMEVLYQPYQFSPVTASSTGFFAKVLARGANETCYKAAREVLYDGNIVGTWLFFRMNDGSRDGEVIGDHVFY